ncbi:hypothetical protein TYRP_018541 [Tyrophagus putrescentiae]|nr:hypothetical protein TYRP_018541 [Tyrophagus putrescentiae]
MWFFTLEDLTLIGKAPCDEKSAAFWKMIQVLPALKRLLLFDYTLDPHNTSSLNFKINLRFFAENLKGKESLKKICLCISQFDVKDVASVNFLKQNPFNSVKHLVLIENFAIDEVYRQQVFLLLPFAFPILERLEVKVFSQEQMSSVSSMKMPKNIQLTVSMRGKK